MLPSLDHLARRVPHVGAWRRHRVPPGEVLRAMLQPFRDADVAVPDGALPRIEFLANELDVPSSSLTGTLMDKVRVVFSFAKVQYLLPSYGFDDAGWPYLQVWERDEPSPSP